MQPWWITCNVDTWRFFFLITKKIYKGGEQREILDKSVTKRSNAGTELTFSMQSLLDSDYLPCPWIPWIWRSNTTNKRAPSALCKISIRRFFYTLLVATTTVSRKANPWRSSVSRNCASMINVGDKVRCVINVYTLRGVVKFKHLHHRNGVRTRSIAFRFSW